MPTPISKQFNSMLRIKPLLNLCDFIKTHTSRAVANLVALGVSRSSLGQLSQLWQIDHGIPAPGVKGKTRALDAKKSRIYRLRSKRMSLSFWNRFN